LKKGQVTGVVRNNEKVYLTVVVNILNEKIEVAGNLRRIHKHTKPFKKQHYIEMIKKEAFFLLETK
jgi:hypothetical protein